MLVAVKAGLIGGSSMDVTPYGKDGKVWSFSNVEMRRRAYQGMLDEDPLVHIGRVMCGD